MPWLAGMAGNAERGSHVYMHGVPRMLSTEVQICMNAQADCLGTPLP